jgi:hypothetical protein
VSNNALLRDRLADIPTVWLERCLDIIALDPDTAQPSTGIPCGLQRPEYGPAIQDLACNACGATWAGIVGEPCHWCQEGLERQQGYQAELLLRPPDVDPADANHDQRMEAWVERMIVGVDAELITRQQADRAWHRATRKSVA